MFGLPETETTEFRYFAVNLPKEMTSVKIVPTSDVHYGNPSCSIKHLKRHIEYIASNPDVFTFLNGDILECVTKTSKGDIYTQVGTPGDQRDFMIDMFMPIKDKILGVTMGNHERRIYHETGVDVSSDIAKALKAPYRPEGMLLKISFGDGNNGTKGRPYVYWLYFTHGYGGARTKSSKAVKVERVATWIHADAYVMSHDHVVNVAPDIYLLPDSRTMVDPKTGFITGKLQAHRKLLIKSNAFLKWSGYAEAGGFPPSDLATPLIKLDGTSGKKRIRVEL